MLTKICKISRLKNFFRAGINYSDYGKILQNTERRITGNLPSDILDSIFRLHPENKKEIILGTQSIFEETASVLGTVNKLEKQAINRMSATPREQERQMYFILKGKMQEQWNDVIYREKTLETVIKAEEVMLKGLKQYFPEAENVIITPLGSGVFGHGFKCEILGKDGKKLIADKVFKIYRNESISEILAEKNKRWLEIVSDEELLEHTKRSVNKYNEMFPQYPMPVPTSATEVRKTILEQHKLAKELAKDTQKVHGAAAEANTSEYLRAATGHKLTAEDGIAIPYMFSLGDTKFAISEFIDKNRKAAKKFEFGRLGLKHGDFELNPNNNYNGICIDLGGITPLSEDIMSNDTALKFLKTLFKTSSVGRKQALDQFKSSASNKNVSQNIISELEKLVVTV